MGKGLLRDTVNLIMMQKIEIRLTLSRLVTQMYASWASSIYLLHLTSYESLIILKETWSRGKNRREVKR